MCYAPTVQSTNLIQRAIARIQEGKIPEAERLLVVAQKQMGRVVNIVYDGKRVGEWYEQAQSMLLKAKRGELGR